MAKWITPIIDRTSIDIDDLTSKAFFNVVDWVRINADTQYIQALERLLLGINVLLTELPEPSITTIPTIDDLNSFIENVDLVRSAQIVIDLDEIKHDYRSGINADVPNYEDVNEWENDILLLKQAILAAGCNTVRAGIAQSGQARFWQIRFRNNLVMPATQIIRPRCGMAVSGSSLLRQDGFRRYV